MSDASRYKLPPDEAEEWRDTLFGFDWHRWIRRLTPTEIESLERAILKSESPEELSIFEKQYFLHLCIASDSPVVSEIDREFTLAQLDGRPQSEIAQIEKRYYYFAKELLESGCGQERKEPSNERN